MTNVRLIKNPKKFWLKVLFWWQKRKYGRVLEPVSAWSYCPTIFWHFLRLFNSFNNSKNLSPTLRSLVSLYVSKINECAYCTDFHAAKILKESPEKVNQVLLYEEAECFSHEEKICLELANKMCKTPVVVSSDLTEEIISHFKEEGLVEHTTAASR